MKTEKLKSILLKVKDGKLILLLAVVGVVLILLPKSKTGGAIKPAAQQESFSLEQQERKLAEALSQISGAGEVTVVLSLDNSGEKTVAQDIKDSEDNSDTRHSRDSTVSTVIITPESGQKTPYVLSERYPQYRGALIIAEGAEVAAVQLAITKAVASLTGLGTDRITVVKMK